MAQFISFQAAKDKLSVTEQPEAVAVWLRRGRDFYKIPACVHPIDNFIGELICWYHSLQPPSRRLKWDYPAYFAPPYLTLPDDPGEWSQLRKGGPYGLFLFVLALSWLPINLRTAEDKIKVEALMKDFVWVLKLLSNPTYINQRVSGTGDSQSGGRKRKLSDVAASLSKKKRKRVVIHFSVVYPYRLLRPYSRLIINLINSFEVI
jgi:hypothetical protein